MNRIYGRGNSYELHMIHNVRPAVELPNPRKWAALTMIFAILMASTALLVFVLGS